MEQAKARYIWPCGWNWCPDTFREKADLLTHLHQQHFNNIFKVQKRDWDAYLRTTEGRSGATDSLLNVNLTYPSTSSTESAAHTGIRGSSASSRQRSPLPATPPPRYPPIPRNVRSSRSQSNASSHAPPPTNLSPMLPPASPSSAQRGPSPAKRRRTSFASYNAQSSPMSTPSVPSVPASPALSNMLADAINRAGQINQQSPHNPNSAAGRLAAAAMQGPPRIVPRRSSMGTSPSPLSQSTHPIQAVPRPMSPSRRGASMKKSISPAGSTKSPSLSRTGSGIVNASGSPPAPPSAGTTFPSSQASSSRSSDGQPQSCYGSHAVESNISCPDSASLPQASVQVKSESNTLPSQPPAASPPLPRTRRARSRATAEPQPSQPPAPAPSRTLRSRSKTPAPAPAVVPPAKIPLPRRTNRSRASTTSSNTNSQPRASSKPPSTRRAGSKPSPAQEQSVAGSAPGLSVLNEVPDEERASADAVDAVASQQQHAFRSGRLQLPRRTRAAPDTQSQSQVQSQVEAQSRSDVPVSVKTEPQDAVAMSVDAPPSQSQSQSQESGGYREGYGFDLGGIQLMTQKPYPSQSQDWSQ